MNKKGSQALIAGVVIFIAVIAALYVSNNLDLGAITAPGEGPNVCLGGQTQNLDLNAYDKETVTATTDAENLYRRMGDSVWKQFTQGSGITGIQPGVDYEFVLGIDNDDETDNTYGGYMTISNLPCILVKDVEVMNDETYDGLTATFYNSDNNAAAQTFSANNVKWIHLKWVAAANEIFGNPYLADAPLSDRGAHRKSYPNALCFNLNSSQWDNPQAVKVDGVSMGRVEVPLVHDGAAGHTTYCYEAPVIGEDEVLFDLQLDADATAPSQDVTAYLYAGGFYIHSETSELMWGSATDDGNFVGAAAADQLTMDFT